MHKKNWKVIRDMNSKCSHVEEVAMTIHTDQIQTHKYDEISCYVPFCLKGFHQKDTIYLYFMFLWE